jgi:hypothetical protein
LHNFKNKVNDLGLAFAGKVGPGALLDFGPALALQRRGARLRQLLRLLLPAHAYSYLSGDLHEDANARFNVTIFNLIIYKQHMTTMKSMVGHIHLTQTHTWYNLSI